jgi:hypothetical protein
MQGIKETKEALLALVLLGAFVAERAKDGLDLSDAVAVAQKLAGDPEFMAKVKAGIDGIGAVPAEIKDLTFAEILELAGVLPELLSAFKK